MVSSHNSSYLRNNSKEMDSPRKVWWCCNQRPDSIALCNLQETKSVRPQLRADPSRKQTHAAIRRPFTHCMLEVHSIQHGDRLCSAGGQVSFGVSADTWALALHGGFYGFMQMFCFRMFPNLTLSWSEGFLLFGMIYVDGERSIRHITHTHMSQVVNDRGVVPTYILLNWIMIHHTTWALVRIMTHI